MDNLIDGDMAFLCAPLDLVELEFVLKRMPTDKTPRLDDIMMGACWSFIGFDVLAMILKFQEIGTIAYKILDEIIRLIPKLIAKQLVIDWWSIMLLNTIYKLIAKILATHLNTLFPDLINEQQTGFVPGRNILNNISIIWMMRDWLAHTSFMALFFSIGL